ncbi:MAG: S9 family peptidase [Enterobacterales bacterium]|nr:S9 family peptidase [Enterobacterales bacterium]
MLISPDGKHVIVIIKRQGREVFGVIDVETRKVLSLIDARGESGNVGSVRWANNERIVYSIYKSSEQDRQYRSTGELFAVNIDGRQHKIIFGHRAGRKSFSGRIKSSKPSHASHQILSILKDDPDSILIAYYPWKLKRDFWIYDEFAYPEIKKLNVYTGRLYHIEKLPISGAEAVVDKNGNVRFAVGVDEDYNAVISYKKTAKSPWKNFSLEQFDAILPQPLNFTQDSKKVYISAYERNGTRALYLFNLMNGRIEKLYHNDEVDIHRFAYDLSGNKIIYLSTEYGKPEYHYLAPRNKISKLHKNLGLSFKGQDVELMSSSRDGNRIVFTVSGDKNPGDFYIYYRKMDKAAYLMSRSSWVYPKQLRTMQSVSFKSRDGQKLQAYLTKPKQPKGNGYPLVVLPHGGPYGIRDHWHFNWMVQLLANRGYAVLQVNFRGSGGFGRSFLRAGYGEWGALMQDDITDGTRYLIDQGIVDAKRICIYGDSYGGYAALMGTVKEPDLYQCAIGSAGVYDLPLMFEKGNIPERMKGGIAYLEDALGRDQAELIKRSPSRNAEKIKANILLIHGGKVEQVPIEQALVMKQALEKLNKPVEWLEFSNEGHGYNDNQNRKQLAIAVLEFLDQNIGSVVP